MSSRANGRRRWRDCGRRSGFTPFSAITNGGRTARCSRPAPACRARGGRWRRPASRSTRTTQDGKAFWLAGLGDQLAFLPSRRLRPGRRIGVDDLAATLTKVTDDAPVVLLAHEPDAVARVPERVTLTLSVHTHGGQVRVVRWSR